MLLMSENGLVYDIPDDVSEKYLATTWNSLKESIGGFLSASEDPAPTESVVAECGCCCVYSNYCPNK